MRQHYPPINPRFPHFLHGGDYNPDQWPPETVADDMRLMKLAHCNAMTLGIFAWAALEPAEGRFEFGWLDRVMDQLAANGGYAVLATPTAAHPRWLTDKYPSVQRTNRERVRSPHAHRVNFCLTSPVYREKAALITRQLAERYRNHPALLAWHVHNEYGGECYCELCLAAFRDWLKRKYGTLEKLNEAWWTAFWSQTYFDWNEIHPFEGVIHGLHLDWKRFATDQCIACYRNEADILHAVTPGVPVTTNTYWFFVGYDARRWAPHLDVIAWDNYPPYHARPEDWKKAVEMSLMGDFYRGLKGGQPFMLMETSPSSQNWMPVMKLQRPGIHRLKTLQVVAHGADTVQYFQWRAGRGAAEKFHGCVVSHSGHENTRVFRDVADLGTLLEKLDGVIGTTVRPEVAVVYDDENRWAIETVAGPRQQKRDYVPTLVAHYEPFWKRGIPVDVVHADTDFAKAGYKLVIAPMLYMLRPGVAERITAFVEQGGTFVTTYWSGIADENDHTFLGGFPGPLRPLLGMWAEELDVLHDDESVKVLPEPGNALGLAGEYEAEIFCDLIHAESATVLARYGSEFYAGRPALTVNACGKGRAFYVASRNRAAFQDDFYGALSRELGLKPVLDTVLPEGVTVQKRGDGKREFLFFLNFRNDDVTLPLGTARLTNLADGAAVAGSLHLPAHDAVVCERV